MATVPTYVAVCGASAAGAEQLRLAEAVGRLLAERGAVVVCGGLGGVTEAASKGATGAGGLVVGLLPGESREGANPYLTVALATGLGQARNVLIVTAADAVIAIGQGWGTLSEIAFARRLGRRVLGLDTWRVEGLETVATPDEAVEKALGT
ncbi:MAG: TIGR00725 family protein [Chloroflexi bacterium]|nr:MAG: TIGR00725 family protein [Chloroflexota bacterium]